MTADAPLRYTAQQDFPADASAHPEQWWCIRDQYGEDALLITNGHGGKDLCRTVAALLNAHHGLNANETSLRDLLDEVTTYLGSLTKDDGSDDDHPARSLFTDVCQFMDTLPRETSSEGVCEACNGDGFIANGERCDACDRFANDDEAFRFLQRSAIALRNAESNRKKTEKG